MRTNDEHLLDSRSVAQHRWHYDCQSEVIDMEKCSPEAREFNKTYLNHQFCELCKEERGLTSNLMPPTTTTILLDNVVANAMHTSKRVVDPTATITTFGYSSVYSLPIGEVDTRNTYLSAHTGNYHVTYAGTSSAMPACHDGMPWCSGASDARAGLPPGSWNEMSLLTGPQVEYAQFELNGQASSSATAILCAVPAPYYNSPTGAILYPAPQSTSLRHGMLRPLEGVQDEVGWQDGFLAVNEIRDSLRAAVEDEELVHDEGMQEGLGYWSQGGWWE
ncbi:hypothetical protein D9613_000103 [Agrocybe pediades]|uniref:Uncharacterized protein n=1 Tax=Agrocybe pediades TaxID=84607 RepID=A0A8H4R2H8_9AGAR|nr:hypothetical protein D9613_000103 [Agrocybe pediades]